MKSTSFCGLFIGIALLCTSCSNDDEPSIVQPTSPEINLTRSEQLVNDNLNGFSLQLFNAISSTPHIVNKAPNFAVSPVSMAIALSMCANICDDDFKASVLYSLDCKNVDDLNVLCRKLMMYLPDPSNKCDISLANAIWHDNGLIPTESSRSAISDYYFGNISALDFSNKQAVVDAVNAWAARSTKNVISKVLDPDDIEGTRVLLANALYFKGQWSKTFDKSKTAVRSFHGIGGDSDVAFMNDRRTLPYIACDRFQAVALGYKGSCELIAVLPSEGSDINDFSVTFNDEDLALCTDDVDKYVVNLSLPKFESGVRTSCNDVLREVGLDLNNARITGISGTDKDAFLEIGHTAKVSTDEDGTVAAAVTIGGDSTSPGDVAVGEVTLTFDRPFIYFIRNVVTGSVIMAGRYVKP